MVHLLKFTTTILTLVLVISISSCFSLADDTGINTFVRELSNKRGDKKVVLFLKEGFLMSDSYQVTICTNNHRLEKGEVGNTFIVDDNNGATILGTESINFIWLSYDSLQIDFKNNLRTFIKEQKVDGVNIVYNAK